MYHNIEIEYPRVHVIDAQLKQLIDYIKFIPNRDARMNGKRWFAKYVLMPVVLQARAQCDTFFMFSWKRRTLDRASENKGQNR